MKKAIYVILAISVVYLILALFGPAKVVVERKITINKSSETIKKHLTDLNFFHSKWSPWTEKDPNMKATFMGEPGVIGHKMEWASDNKDVGSGSMELTGISGDTTVIMLSMGKGKDAKAYYIAEGKDNATNVTWGLEMKIPFLGRGVMLFMKGKMHDMIGGDFEHGLATLKKVEEEMKEEAPAVNYEVKETEWPETTFAGSKKETVKFEKMGEFFGKHLPAIAGELNNMKVQPESAPLGIYWGYNMQEMSADVAAGFRVAKGIKVKGYESYSFPAAKVIQLTYYGDYQKMDGAYKAMDEFMQKKGAAKSVSIEEYVTDPMVEKDTAKWMTNIYYILK